MSAERLQEMADEIRARRRVVIEESVALRLFRENGSATKAEVDAAVEAEWDAPDAQVLRDLVARKLDAAVAHEQVVADQAAEAVRKSEAKVVRYQEIADGVKADHEALVALNEVDAALARKAEWQALLDEAVAAGADPGRAPTGRNLAVSPQGAGR
jgi:hypothetical protein